MLLRIWLQFIGKGELIIGKEFQQRYICIKLVSKFKTITTMKTIKILLLLLCIPRQILPGQILVPDEILKIQAGIEDEVQITKIDDGGNIYMAGVFKSSNLTIGSETIINSGSNDIFLIKLGPDFQLKLASSFYNSGYAKVTDLDFDTESNIIICGIFNSTVKFDTITYTASGGYQTFITKISNDAKIKWAKDYSQGSSYIAIDKNSSIYLSNPLHNIRKLSSEGIEQWSKPFGGKLLIDNAQNLYMLGSYSDSVQFGSIILKTIYPYENHNVYVAKADTNGDVIWAKKFCEKEHALLWNTFIDKDANAITFTGTYKTDSLTFDSTIIRNHGTADIFYAKIDTSAKIITAKSFGGKSPEYAWGLTKINNQYSAIVGRSSSDSIQFGNFTLRCDTNNYSFGDFIILLIDNSGNPVWAKSFPMSSGQNVKAIISDTNQNTFIVGDFSSNSSVSELKSTYADSPTYIDQTSIYIIGFKHNNTNNFTTNTGVSPIVKLYPNPVSGTLNIILDKYTSGYQVLVINAEGKILIRDYLGKDKNQINVSRLPNGIYIIRISDNNNIITSRFIKQ